MIDFNTILNNVLSDLTTAIIGLIFLTIWYFLTGKKTIDEWIDKIKPTSSNSLFSGNKLNYDSNKNILSGDSSISRIDWIKTGSLITHLENNDFCIFEVRAVEKISENKYEFSVISRTQNIAKNSIKNKLKLSPIESWRLKKDVKSFIDRINANNDITKINEKYRKFIERLID